MIREIIPGTITEMTTEKTTGMIIGTTKETITEMKMVRERGGSDAWPLAEGTF